MYLGPSKYAPGRAEIEASKANINSSTPIYTSNRTIFDILKKRISQNWKKIVFVIFVIALIIFGILSLTGKIAYFTNSSNKDEQIKDTII